MPHSPNSGAPARTPTPVPWSLRLCVVRSAQQPSSPAAQQRRDLVAARPGGGATWWRRDLVDVVVSWLGRIVPMWV